MKYYIMTKKRGYRKRYQKTKKAQSDVATKAYVKKQLTKNTEFRKEDLISSNLITPTTQPVPLTAILSSNRDGLVANIRSILLRWNLALQTSLSANILPFARIIIFIWYPKSVPILSDVLENTTTGHITLSPINRKNTRQIKVLFDKTYAMSRNVHENIHQSYYKRGNQKLRYDDSGSTPVAMNIAYILTVSDRTTAGDQPNFTLYRRVNYTDS